MKGNPMSKSHDRNATANVANRRADRQQTIARKQIRAMKYGVNGRNGGI